tara:strand:- start:2998 stop:3498 length:501 start_codon:yes stop_codon:yes gene_type:complete
MDLKGEVNPVVTGLLKDIIVETSQVWGNYTVSGETDYELFTSYEVPKTNIDRPPVGLLLTELDHPKLLEVTELLGATHCTNATYLPPKSMMYWHTNSDNEGERTYYNFTLEPGIFKYVDPQGNYIEDWDDKGWTTRSFKITKKDPLWHCVWADAGRFSFGFTKKLL